MGRQKCLAALAWEFSISETFLLQNQVYVHFHTNHVYPKQSYSRNVLPESCEADPHDKAQGQPDHWDEHCRLAAVGVGPGADKEADDDAGDGGEDGLVHCHRGDQLLDLNLLGLMRAQVGADCGGILEVVVACQINDEVLWDRHTMKS